MPALKTSLVLLLAVLYLAACSTFDRQGVIQTLAVNQAGNASVPNVPFFPQEKYQCGPASLAMMLVWAGVEVDPVQLKPLLYVPDKRGSFQLEMSAAVRKYNRIAFLIPPNYRSLLQELQAGHPVLVFQNLGLSWYPEWHYAVLTGIDLEAGEARLHSGTIADYHLNLATFDKTWQRSHRWAMVVLPPHSVPASVGVTAYTKVVYDLERSGRSELAMSAYQAAIKHWPSDIDLKMALANLNYTKSLYQRALDLYQDVLSLEADYAPAHNNLAQAYFSMGEYQAALKHAEQAVRLAGPFQASYQDTLNSVKHKLAN
ncbi:MAG: PA2778 family cysteine peptidase [Thiohalomonadales bacterium]